MKNTWKYACDICDVTFIDSTDLNMYNAIRKHIDKDTGVNSVVSPSAENMALRKRCYTEKLL